MSRTAISPQRPVPTKWNEVPKIVNPSSPPHIKATSPPIAPPGPINQPPAVTLTTEEDLSVFNYYLVAMVT